MDRPPHDYAAMAFAQHQQQAANMPPPQQPYGFHPQHQQYPLPVHGSPFMPQQPPIQQYPYPRPMQPLGHHPHPPPHPNLLHLQQQQQPPSSFPPHLPPHLVPPPFHNMYDSAPPPPPSPPPPDPELQKVIDKLVEYAAKNGPEFEAMIREKQQDNPAYSFLFGGEGHNYYRYRLWLSTRSFSMSMMHHPPNPMMNMPPLNASPPMQQPPFPPFYDQQQHHPQGFLGHARPDYDQPTRSFKGLSRPLPSDVAMELNDVLNSLTGTKESIKGAKIWFMQRSPFAPALAEELRDRVFALDDSERQLHIIYLANDILFDSLQRRMNLHDLDNEAHAFKPVLGSMLSRIYHNPKNKEENQSRLQKILQFWASKEVYDRETIIALENEMMGGSPMASFPHSQKQFSAIPTDPSPIAGSLQQASNSLWQSPNPNLAPNLTDQEHPDKQIHLRPSMPPGGFAGSIPIPSPSPQPNQQPGPHLLPTPTPIVGEKLPPYPLFPPGLIPGMVRKMQIGSGVPYSPMSPLDIPTVIPPSDVSPSEVLDKVSKFFREIGEANPFEGPTTKRSGPSDEYEEYEERREAPVRKGGACIPPPPNLQVDPETGTYADGSVERKPGSSSTGRLGLGAIADPNEASQYDDVYTSYRKQRSTNYHTSMSARATTTTTATNK